ncbi:hypothetical protein BN1708_017498, partial [Verticillium longisporum]
ARAGGHQEVARRRCRHRHQRCCGHGGAPARWWCQRRQWRRVARRPGCGLCCFRCGHGRPQRAAAG